MLQPFQGPPVTRIVDGSAGDLWSFGSNVAPWAAGWSGPGSGMNTPGLPAQSLPGGMTQVGALGGNTNSGLAPASSLTNGASSVGGLDVANLAPISVSANATAGGPIAGFTGPVQVSGGGATGGATAATNLPGVTVTANAPSLGQKLATLSQQHPFLTTLATTALNSVVPLAGTIVQGYINHENGKPLLSSPLLSSLGNLFSGATSGSGGTSASPTPVPSLQDLQPRNYLPDPNSGGSGSGLLTGAALPAYSGLSALAGYGAPLGGYWNQQALKMAAPVYGPYAGFGGTTPQPINYANPFAPSGIVMAGY